MMAFPKASRLGGLAPIRGGEPELPDCVKGETSERDGLVSGTRSSSFFTVKLAKGVSAVAVPGVVVFGTVPWAVRA